MKLPIRWNCPPLIVLACMVVLALTTCNFFGFLSPQFPNRPEFLPQASAICEGRIARMSEERLRGTRLWVDRLFCQDGEVMRAMPGMAQLTVNQAQRAVEGEAPSRIAGLEGALPAPIINDRVRFRSHLHTPHSYHNPGAIDWERKAASDGVAWTGAVESPDWIMVVQTGHGSPLRVIDQWRQTMSQQIATINDPETRGSAAALLLGSAGLLPEQFGDGLRYLGIIHLYVISGLHVAVVAWAVYELLYWLLSRRTRWALRHPLWRWAAGGSLVAVWIYVGLVGGGVAVVRAGIMVTVYLAALILDRHPHVGAAIALAALLLILQSPHVIFIPGFQLSFVAVMALVAVYPCLFKKLRVGEIRWRIWRWCVEGLLAALVATWATAPIVAYHFHQTPLLGIPANLIAGPYTTIVLMPLGFAWTLLTGLPAVASLVQQLWIWAAWPLVQAVKWTTPLAESTQWTFTPTVWEMAWWYAAGIYVVLRYTSKTPLSGIVTGPAAELPHLSHRDHASHSSASPSAPSGMDESRGSVCWRKWGPHSASPVTMSISSCAGIVLCAAIGLLLIIPRIYDIYRTHPLQLTFLDVGQGASVLVEFPNRHTMLIDGGGVPGSDFDIGRWVVAPALLARGITQVDDLVLTHPHPDHYGGLGYIAGHFHPTHFYTNGSQGEEGDAQWQAFLQRMQAAQMSPENLHRGMKTTHGDVHMTWRHPPETGPDESLGKNNGSVVADLRYGGFRALIVGDIQEEAEVQILEDPAIGPVTVLQVPHHASRTSSTPAFLQHMRPQLAVAQLGFENRYGFPHPEVARRYSEMGILLCRNDRDGAVTISVNSPTNQFSIQTGSEGGTCSARAR